MKTKLRKFVAFAMAMIMAGAMMITMVACVGGDNNDPLAFMLMTEKEARERGGTYLLSNGKFYALDSFPYENAMKYGVGARIWGTDEASLQILGQDNSAHEYVAAGKIPKVEYHPGDKIVAYDASDDVLWLSTAVELKRYGLPICDYYNGLLYVRISVDVSYIVPEEQLRIACVNENNREVDWYHRFSGGNNEVTLSILDHSGQIQQRIDLKADNEVYYCWAPNFGIIGEFMPAGGYREFDLLSAGASGLVVIGTTLIQVVAN